jgi:hypothetical protein
MSRGRAALEAWDYDAAREAFGDAVKATHGAPEPARALLDLLVHTLADDAGAMGVEPRLSQEALRDPEVRTSLALAAGRIGDRDHARRLSRDVNSADVLALLGGLAVRDGDANDAMAMLLALRELEPGHAALSRITEGIQRIRAEERRPAEVELQRAVERAEDATIETVATAILVRWPTSEPALAALAAVERRRRSGQSKGLIASAREAWSAGNVQQAGALVRRAQALGVDDPALTAWLAEVEAAVAEAAEIAAIKLALERVREGRLQPYLALGPAARREVREAAARPLLEWIEALGRTPEAVAAALALEAALERPSDARPIAGTHAYAVSSVTAEKTLRTSSDELRCRCSAYGNER